MSRRITDAQAKALTELSYWDCVGTSRDSGKGRVNSRSANALVDSGYAERWWVGRIITERPVVAVDCWVYAITRAGRAALGRHNEKLGGAR